MLTVPACKANTRSRVATLMQQRIACALWNIHHNSWSGALPFGNAFAWSFNLMNRWRAWDPSSRSHYHLTICMG